MRRSKQNIALKVLELRQVTLALGTKMNIVKVREKCQTK